MTLFYAMPSNASAPQQTSAELSTISINCNHPTLPEQIVCYPNNRRGVFDKTDTDSLALIFECEQLNQTTIATVKKLAKEKGYLERWSGTTYWQVNSDGSIVFTHKDDPHRFDVMVGMVESFMHAIYEDVDYHGKPHQNK